MSDTQKRWYNFIWISLLALSIVAAVVKIFVGFDIDEGYAVSMPYRLLQNDALFLDMWEVHQTSVFLPAVFLSVFDKITGATDGAVLFLRVVATLIHAGMSGFVFAALKKKTGGAWAALLAVLYLNLLPKWLVSLDFSLQQVWGITLILILLGKEAETGKKVWSFWIGIVLAMTVLAYPGMVLAYPALMLSVCMLHPKEEVKRRFNKCVLLTSGCAVMAVIFLVYVLSAMSLSEFVESIPMVFMDGTHQFTMQTKLMAYGAQWMNVTKQLLILSAPSVIITTIFYALSKRKRIWKSGKCGAEMLIMVYLLSFVTVTSLLVLFANVAGIQMGPFHFQVRYLLFFLLTFVWSVYLLRREKDEEIRFLFWGPMFQMMVAFVAILIFSNVGPDSSSSYLSVGLIAGVLVLQKVAREMDKRWNHVIYGIISLFVLSLIFCKGYYVRITEYGPANILEPRKQIEKGAVAGIYVSEEDYERITSDYDTIRAITAEEEKLLYLGTEGISNLYAKGSFVSPSTISTPAFNEQWVNYFEKYPHHQPDVIVLAKNTIDNREKFFAENPLGIWISQRYDIESMEETKSLCMIRKGVNYELGK
ncbi:MAG: hypothetical protein J6B19_00255 [Lachnospiraceae bacterium]|nr:hypothetical protein [Lachnospiraceae bacterium]